MTATELVTALAAELRVLLRDVKFPPEHQSSQDVRLVPVNVYEGFLPKDAFNDDSYYPLVVVEWLSTADELDGSHARTTMTAALSMGVFAPEAYAWKDAYHLTQVVRHHLLTHRLLAGKFRLIDSANWEVAPDQPSPFFYTYATLTYQSLQPEDLSWEVSTC